VLAVLDLIVVSWLPLAVMFNPVVTLYVTPMWSVRLLPLFVVHPKVPTVHPKEPANVVLAPTPLNIVPVTDNADVRVIVFWERVTLLNDIPEVLRVQVPKVKLLVPVEIVPAVYVSVGFAAPPPKAHCVPFARVIVPAVLKVTLHTTLPVPVHVDVPMKAIVAVPSVEVFMEFEQVNVPPFMLSVFEFKITFGFEIVTPPVVVQLSPKTIVAAVAPIVSRQGKDTPLLVIVEAALTTKPFVVLDVKVMFAPSEQPPAPRVMLFVNVNLFV